MPITGSTRIVGIFGYPVKHTLSPLMHNAAFAHLGLDYVYLPFEVRPKQLEQALRALPALQVAGVNLTIPHKEQALKYLDEISEEARLIGAVNTVKVEGESLIGYNTDGAGFVRSLSSEAGVDPKGKNVCLLGAGGAARGVAIALAMAGIEKLVILNRTVERAQALAEHVAKHFPHIPTAAYPLAEQKSISESQVVVNATAVGLQADQPLLVDPQLIQPESLACDLIYGHGQTKFLAAATRRGAKVMDGLGMLVYQGALAFEIWTGREAPVQVMQKEVFANL